MLSGKYSAFPCFIMWNSSFTQILGFFATEPKRQFCIGHILKSLHQKLRQKRYCLISVGRMFNRCAKWIVNIWTRLTHVVLSFLICRVVMSRFVIFAVVLVLCVVSLTPMCQSIALKVWMLTKIALYTKRLRIHTAG